MIWFARPNMRQYMGVQAPLAALPARTKSDLPAIVSSGSNATAAVGVKLGTARNIAERLLLVGTGSWMGFQLYCQSHNRLRYKGAFLCAHAQVL